MKTVEFDLHINAFGHLVLTDGAGLEHVDVVVARAFPISAPDEGVSLLDRDGHELAWIARLSALPERQRELIADALVRREFMPVIRRLVSVSSFSMPSTWTVETDRGDAELVLKGHEDIRRLGADRLLVDDAHGVQYLIADLDGMDRASRRLLDRFM